MVENATSWVKQNTGIVAILVGQTIALVGGIAYVVNWKADIESRIHILEERGSPHLAQINNRLTVTEKETTANKERIDRVVEIMLRELPIKRDQLKP
jgi:hypothetical protein